MAAAGGGLAAGALGACASVPGEGGAAAKRNKATDAAAWSAARQFAPLKFGEVAYVERGNGPAALFLHGFPLRSFQWARRPSSKALP